MKTNQFTGGRNDMMHALEAYNFASAQSSSQMVTAAGLALGKQSGLVIEMISAICM